MKSPCLPSHAGLVVVRQHDVEVENRQQCHRGWHRPALRGRQQERVGNAGRVSAQPGDLPRIVDRSALLQAEARGQAADGCVVQIDARAGGRVVEKCVIGDAIGEFIFAHYFPVVIDVVGFTERIEGEGRTDVRRGAAIGGGPRNACVAVSVYRPTTSSLSLMPRAEPWPGILPNLVTVPGLLALKKQGQPGTLASVAPPTMCPVTGSMAVAWLVVPPPVPRSTMPPALAQRNA